MAKGRRAEVLIAHVLAPPVPMTTNGYVLPRIADEMAAAIRADGERRMRRLLARVRKAGVDAKGILLNGPTPEAVARAARKHRVELVVVGTRGRTGMARLLLGSVASRIVATAPCPVLTVRGR
jgi:nucleotide-binding universal stress UspA family protein